MINEEEILKKLIEAQAYLANLRAEFPKASDLRKAKIRLDDLESEFSRSWPIEDSNKAQDLGLFAAKILDNGPYKELPRILMKLAGQMDGGT
jgi:hypothetical protein